MEEKVRNEHRTWKKCNYRKEIPIVALLVNCVRNQKDFHVFLWLLHYFLSYLYFNVVLQHPNVALPNPNVALSDSNVALPKRYTKEQLKEKIREVCSDWVTAEVIAARIGRDVNYVKNHVLPNLADVIEKMYDIPHHPRQKYRAKQEEGDA